MKLNEMEYVKEQNKGCNQLTQVHLKLAVIQCVCPLVYGFTLQV